MRARGFHCGGTAYTKPPFIRRRRTSRCSLVRINVQSQAVAQGPGSSSVNVEASRWMASTQMQPASTDSGSNSRGRISRSSSGAEGRTSHTRDA